MQKNIWLILGNKGSVGKSVVTKAFIEWLQTHDLPVIAIDGDDGARDVAKTFQDEIPTEVFDLSVGTGWAEFADWICSTNYESHIVTNMPDGVTEKTIQALQRYSPAMEAMGYQINALFVMNTLADGIDLLPYLVRTIKHVHPIKNLFFGQSVDFTYFNRKYQRHFSDNTVYFPRAYPRVMNQVRAAYLPYSTIAASREQTITTRLEITSWLERALEAFDETLMEEL